MPANTEYFGDHSFQVGGPTHDGTSLPIPLSPLVMELLRAASGDILREIVVGDLWVTITDQAT